MKTLREQKIDIFTRIRKAFEDFLYKNVYTIDQINRNMRSTKIVQNH